MALCTLNASNTLTRVGRPVISAPESGFDDLGRTFRVETTNIKTLLESAIPKGSADTDWTNMHIADWRPKNIVGDIWEVEVAYRGLFSEKPRKRTVRAYSERHGGLITWINGQATPQPFSPMQSEVTEPAVAVTESYVHLSFPNTAEVASHNMPTLPPPVPPNVWITLVDPIYRAPNGWVLENRAVDEIAGTNVCFVQDEWLYYHHLKPSG